MRLVDKMLNSTLKIWVATSAKFAASKERDTLQKFHLFISITVSESLSEIIYETVPGNAGEVMNVVPNHGQTSHSCVHGTNHPIS